MDVHLGCGTLGEKLRGTGDSSMALRDDEHQRINESVTYRTKIGACNNIIMYMYDILYLYFDKWYMYTTVVM